MPDLSGLMEGAAGEAIGGLVLKVAASLYGYASKAQEPQVDLGSFVFTDEAGESLILTQQQVDAVRNLISSPEVTALAQTYALAVSVRRRYADVSDWTAAIDDSFKSLFNSAMGSGPASGAADIIWRILVHN